MLISQVMKLELQTTRRHSYDKKKLRVVLKIYFRVVLGNSDKIFRKYISDLFLGIK